MKVAKKLSKIVFNIILLLFGLFFVLDSIALFSPTVEYNEEQNKYYEKRDVATGTIFIIIGVSLLIIPTKNITKYMARSIKKQIKVEKKEEPIELDKPTISGNWLYKRKDFAVNEKEQLLLINSHKYSYSDIVDFELMVDDTSITKTSMGSAISKSLLFGDILGGTTAKKKNIDYCTKLKIKITINNINNPIEYIDFMKGFQKLKKSSLTYKNIISNAEEILSILKIITK